MRSGYYDKTHIIALPYAGGSKYCFKEFQPYFGNDIVFSTIELPGRGQRILEPLLTSIDAMVDDLYKQLLPYTKGRYVLYGHSMGGVLGNLLIHKLTQTQQALPLFFVATGCAAPQKRNYEILRHLLNNTDFKESLCALGGLPEEILADEGFMDFFLPIIRADMQALECYALEDKGTYAVPIIAIAGTNERIKEAQLQAWQLETSLPIETHWYEGNHFFILQHFSKIARLIRDKLAKTQLRRA